MARPRWRRQKVAVDFTFCRHYLLPAPAGDKKTAATFCRRRLQRHGGRAIDFAGHRYNSADATAQPVIMIKYFDTF